MIIDGVRVTDAIRNLSSGNPAVAAFLAYIERKLNVVIVRDFKSVPWGRPEIGGVASLVETLGKKGILKSVRPIVSPPDEPQLKRWEATGGGNSEHMSGGASLSSEKNAFLATVAESLERYLWSETTDYFKNPVTMSKNQMRGSHAHIAPERFAAFSPHQRSSDKRYRLDPDAAYLWIEGQSLITNKPVYLPAQTVSGSRGLRQAQSRNEPFIRPGITTGLATWPDKSTARLKGALEVIERDAYMIMWLNQLTLPRIELTYVAQTNPALQKLIDTCSRYGLKIHAVRLITDAPTFAICVVIEDLRAHAPRYSLGLKAGPVLADTIEGAAVEALRARTSYRSAISGGMSWDDTTPVHEIGHYDRLFYWGNSTHAPALRFMIAGPETAPEAEVWEKDTAQQHLNRIVAWCAQRGYECISVSLGTPQNNPLPWYVEMTVIPELQPTFLFEKNPVLGGTRLRIIPESFGYPHRDPFLEAPHPFA